MAYRHEHEGSAHGCVDLTDLYLTIAPHVPILPAARRKSAMAADDRGATPPPLGPKDVAALALLLLLGAWLLLLRRRTPSPPPFATPLPAPPRLEPAPGWPRLRRVAARTRLRAAAALDSEPRGVLEAGQLVLVLAEHRELGAGRVRARVCRLSDDDDGGLGWLSVVAEGGEPILLPLPPAEAASAWRWRGLTLAERPSARRDAVAAFRRAWAAASEGTPEDDRAPTTSAKLRHDAEQLEWLVSRGDIDALGGAAAADALRATERQLFAAGSAREAAADADVAHIQPPTLAALRGWYRAPLHVASSDAVAGGALGRTVDWAHVLDSYRATAPASCVVVDNFLSGEALDSLVHYCRASTIFDDFMYKGGCASAY